MTSQLSASHLDASPDTYLYALAAASDGKTYATIGSDDSLRLFDLSLNVLQRIRPAHSGIACLSTFHTGFATAGRDGLVRCWDSRGTRSTLQLSEPKGNGFSAIACHEHVIATGTESTKEGLGEVSVLLYDTRNPSTPVRNYGESHTDSITQLAFHPSHPNVLLSGSTDGLVSIFDANISEEEDALQQVLNPRSAVHCAGFLSPTEVYVVTTDEHFSIHLLTEQGDDAAGSQSSILDLGDVRDKLRCTYVVDLKPGPIPIMIYGHNTEERLSFAHLDRSKSYDVGEVIDLPGAHGDEVVRDLLVVADKSRALSCGEDGQVRLWSLSH